MFQRRLALILAIMSLTVACGKSPKQARKELVDIGIEYSDQGFNKAVETRDRLAIDLFIQADHDASYVLKGAILAYGKEENRDIKLINQLIKNSTNFNTKHQVNLGLGGIVDVSTLDAAILVEDLDLVKLLISKGADVNYNNGEGLRKALIDEENKEISDFLISQGADINSKSQGTSLLLKAMFAEDAKKKFTPKSEIEPKGETKKELDVVDYLFGKQVEVNDGDEGNSFALMFAIAKKDLKRIEKLLSMGANVNSTWENPNSLGRIHGLKLKKYSLHEIAEGDPEIIKLLNKYQKQQASKPLDKP